jgi:peptidyl-tRNA hydrolase
MMNDSEDLVCYVLVRTDLPSLNPGKAMSQVHHAGVQMCAKHSLHTLVESYIQQGTVQGADHFNTTIVLGATLAQVKSVMDQAAGYQKSEVVFDVVVDPSYPFFVENEEIANLIPQTEQVKIIKVMPDYRVLMVRPEVTCAWFLGDRNDLRFRVLFDGLDLHP